MGGMGTQELLIRLHILTIVMKLGFFGHFRIWNVALCLALACDTLFDARLRTVAMQAISAFGFGHSPWIDLRNTGHKASTYR
jgi:hypothetical protein